MTFTTNFQDVRRHIFGAFLSFFAVGCVSSGESKKLEPYGSVATPALPAYYCSEPFAIFQLESNDRWSYYRSYYVVGESGEPVVGEEYFRLNAEDCSGEEYSCTSYYAKDRRQAIKFVMPRNMRAGLREEYDGVSIFLRKIGNFPRGDWVIESRQDVLGVMLQITVMLDGGDTMMFDAPNLADPLGDGRWTCVLVGEFSSFPF